MALCTKTKATPICIRKASDNSKQTALSLTEQKLPFRVRRVVELCLHRHPVVCRYLAQPFVRVAVLQREVMYDPKDPSATVLAGQDAGLE